MTLPTPTSPQSPRPDRSSRAWAGLCVALGLASLAIGLVDLPIPLAWHAELWRRAPWVLWTASLVHLTPAHLLVNLGALAVLGVLGAFVQAGRTAAHRAAAGLAARQPGAGLVAAGSMVMADVGLADGDGRRLVGTHGAAPRPQGVVYRTVCRAGAQAAERTGLVPPIVFDPQWGFNVVVAAHLAGALAGAASGLLCGGLHRLMLLRQARP